MRHETNRSEINKAIDRLSKGKPTQQDLIALRLKTQMLDYLLTRPLNFTASFHGSSTIICDGGGRWCTGQVDPLIAVRLANALSEYVRTVKNNLRDNPITLVHFSSSYFPFWGFDGDPEDL